MMQKERIEFLADGLSRWAGYKDLMLISPDRQHEIALRYVGEPPHGDSYHEAEVSGARIPGFIWGCNFAFTVDSRFFAASWMAKLYERKTIVVDIERYSFFVLPVYIYDFTFHWPVLEGLGIAEGLRYVFIGTEGWIPF